MKRITKEMVREGLRRGIIEVTDDAERYGCIGLACRIGDNAFYFAGEEGELMSADEYVKRVPMEDIAEEIFLTLDGDGGIRTEFEEEYEYYRLFLDYSLKDQ